MPRAPALFVVVGPFVAALASSLLPLGCAHTREDDPSIEEVVSGDGDPTLDALEQAFLALRAGDHDDARAWLEDATATFDDLALEGTTLEKAFAADARKPYRGRPHERVLASVVLAALDIERGRCDLALPSLKNAAWLDARSDPQDTTDVALVHVLTLRCLMQRNAAAGDVERARDDLRRALDIAGSPGRAFELEALAAAPDLALAFDGEGPEIRAAGDAGERAIFVPSSSTTTSLTGRVEEAPIAADAVVVQLGDRPADATTGLTVWSSTYQATTVQGRPFEEVLRERAAFRRRSLNEGSRLVHEGLRDVTTAVDRGRSKPVADRQTTLAAILSGGAVATAGMGLAALGAATDARPDLRSVTTLFERGVLLGERPLAWMRTDRGASSTSEPVDASLFVPPAPAPAPRGRSLRDRALLATARGGAHDRGAGAAAAAAGSVPPLLPP